MFVMGIKLRLAHRLTEEMHACALVLCVCGNVCSSCLYCSCSYARVIVCVCVQCIQMINSQLWNVCICGAYTCQKRNVYHHDSLLGAFREHST